MDWIQIISSFILGGGLLALITIKYSNKTAKVDAYVKLEKFWQESNQTIRGEFQTRVSELEKRIDELEITVCRNIKCKTRIK
ncbi:MAG: hypothetical protein WCI49_10095 [Ferruginibacter sp.]